MKAEKGNGWATVWLAALAVSYSTAVWSGESTPVSLDLFDARFELDRLAPDREQGEAAFVVDDAGFIEFDVTSTLPELSVRIEAPSGEIIDETTIASFGGELASFEGGPGGGALFASVMSPGFHTLYRFPSVGPGIYTVRFAATATLTREEAVFTRLRTGSPVVVGLIATEPRVVLGNPAVLTAAVFDGAEPVTGASAEVTVKDPTGAYTTLELLDDGNEADTAAGDGLYSVQFEPSLTGSFFALADIAGMTSTGLPFVRQAAAELSVVAALSRLADGFNDVGIDDNGNGSFDRISIEMGTVTSEAGEYRLLLRLETSDGQSLVRHVTSFLTSGTETLSVDFEAGALRELGVDGPYEVTLAELLLLRPEGVITADRRENLGQTQPYDLRDAERSDLALTGVTTDRAFDDNANALFDRLVVEVEIEVPASGTYQWSYKLMSQALDEIAFEGGSANLSAGVRALPVTFPGRAIGDSGIDGPYLLRDLLLFGAGHSLVVTEIGHTGPYAAEQFEGSNRPPDCSSAAGAGVELWPPNHKMVTIDVSSVAGITDPDGDSVTVIVDIITQDEPVNTTGRGDGDTTTDGAGIGSGAARVRAERDGNGNGRVYRIRFTAEDDRGGSCQGDLEVSVPHSRRGSAAIDDGQAFDSTGALR